MCLVDYTLIISKYGHSDKIAAKDMGYMCLYHYHDYGQGHNIII